MKIFKKWIEKNSQKSEIEKKGVAIFYSFLITLVIFMIWAVTLFGSFNIDSHLASSSQKKLPDQLIH